MPGPIVIKKLRIEIKSSAILVARYSLHGIAGAFCHIGIPKHIFICQAHWIIKKSSYHLISEGRRIRQLNLLTLGRSPRFSAHLFCHRLQRLVHGVAHALHGLAHGGPSGPGTRQNDDLQHGARYHSGGQAPQKRTGFTHPLPLLFMTLLVWPGPQKIIPPPLPKSGEVRIIVRKNLRIERFCLSLQSQWGISSVGRAFEWHSKGQEFDSPMLHFPLNKFIQALLSL